MNGFNYIEFIAPGLIMMAIINNSYGNVVSSFFGAKFQKHIEEMLVAPIPNIVILTGFVTGGVARGILVGIVVTLVALFFTKLSIIFIISRPSVSALGFVKINFVSSSFFNTFNKIRMMRCISCKD